MIFKHKIQINSSPHKIWPFIEMPDRMKLWNHRIKAIVPVTAGEPLEGFQYRVRYEINGREGNYLVEMLEHKAPEKLVMHYTGGNFPIRGYALDTYRLIENSSGTLIEQHFELHRSGINILSRFLMISGNWILRSSAKKYLKKLKELVEAES